MGDNRSGLASTKISSSGIHGYGHVNQNQAYTPTDTETDKKRITHSEPRQETNEEFLKKYNSKSVLELHQILRHKQVNSVNVFQKYISQVLGKMHRPGQASLLHSTSNSPQHDRTSVTTTASQLHQHQQNGNYHSNETKIKEEDKEEESNTRTSIPKSEETGRSSAVSIQSDRRKSTIYNVSISELRINCKKVLRGHRQRPASVDWNSKTGDLVSVARDGLLLIWDPVTEHKKYAIGLSCEFVMSVRYSASGRVVDLCAEAYIQIHINIYIY
ncbi:hypothetical protein RFI_18163, partial [Reticulomyxa filosa]